MIIERTPLCLNEVEEIVENSQDSEKKEKTKQFLKKFLKIKPEQAKKIKEEIKKLDSLKIKEEHIVKIIDFLPSDVSDLNKIFVDVGLNEDEINKILEIVKKSNV